jgi:hypothetical protein
LFRPPPCYYIDYRTKLGLKSFLLIPLLFYQHFVSFYNKFPLIWGSKDDMRLTCLICLIFDPSFQQATSHSELWQILSISNI